MYSDKHTVNALVALLIAKGVRQAVLCPGSRNIPLVADFCEAAQVACHAVTDERSAGFYAMGIALATGQPVVLCLTSGSALLNAAPAVCEAYYRHVPLIVVSADRPKAWIGRNDGQTMVQTGALANFVRAQADIDDADPADTDTCAMQSLLLNATINKALDGERGPAHINVHLSEPLFAFGTPQLPPVRSIVPLATDHAGDGPLAALASRFMTAPNRMVVIGQLPHADRETDRLVERLKDCCLVVGECLSSAAGEPADRIMDVFRRSTPPPIDALLSLGGNFVGKNIKAFLRTHTVREHWEVNADGQAHDTFGAQTAIVKADTKALLKALLAAGTAGAPCPAREQWNKAKERTLRAVGSYKPPFSQMLAVQAFENALDGLPGPWHVHYGNSMAVRVGSLYAHHYVWCNRGVNGIEGSLSTAAGFSLATADRVFCVVGDLSFFYDQNALWNNSLKGNLRILVINNAGGGIFAQLGGLHLPDKTMHFVAGQHTATAKGICGQNGLRYLQAGNADELQRTLPAFMAGAADRPVVLEVFTNADDDRKAMRDLADRLTDPTL